MSAVGQGEQSPDKVPRYFEEKSRKSLSRSSPRNMESEYGIVVGSSRNGVTEHASQMSSALKGRRTKQERKSGQKKPRAERENLRGLKVEERPSESPKSKNA